MPAATHEHVRAEHTWLLDMVQDRRMGLAVSYRWLENCLLNDDLMPASDWLLDPRENDAA